MLHHGVLLIDSLDIGLEHHGRLLHPFLAFRVIKNVSERWIASPKLRFQVSGFVYQLRLDTCKIHRRMSNTFEWVK